MATVIDNQPSKGVGGLPSVPQGQGEWMEMPDIEMLSCPIPGLEYLAILDQVLIHQQIEIVQALTDIDMRNRYQIKNSMGQQFAFAKEESGFCMRFWCKEQRGFVINFTNNLGQEVMRATREFKCCAGCCWCANFNHCAFELIVEAPIGQVIGYVRQNCSKWKGIFSILNEEREEVLKIRGPCCICVCPCARCNTADFKIETTDNQNEIGVVSKLWSGALKECCQLADNFGVQFPMDMDIKTKALLLGATFLIDFMFYEKRNND